MDTLGEEVGERGVDRALAFEAALADERLRDDLDREMAFAARIVAGMAAMLRAVVDHGEPFGSECRTKAFLDLAGHRPGASI